MDDDKLEETVQNDTDKKRNAAQAVWAFNRGILLVSIVGVTFLVVLLAMFPIPVQEATANVQGISSMSFSTAGNGITVYPEGYVLNIRDASNSTISLSLDKWTFTEEPESTECRVDIGNQVLYYNEDALLAQLTKEHFIDMDEFEMECTLRIIFEQHRRLTK